MKPLDKYRLFGQPGRVIYVLGPKDRILGARLLVGLMAGWIAAVAAAVWIEANMQLILSAYAVGVMSGTILFYRIRGRRHVIGSGFSSTGQAFTWRKLVPLVSIWAVAIALLAAILVWLR